MSGKEDDEALIFTLSMVLFAVLLFALGWLTFGAPQ